MDKIPLETLALIVAAVRCAIDEWTTGRRVRVDFEFEPYAGTYKTVLNHLRGWVTFAASQTVGAVDDRPVDLSLNLCNAKGYPLKKSSTRGTKSEISRRQTLPPYVMLTYPSP
ncbi:hypothetical protein B0H14DRAFT_2571807 [Mycena olivaceomarginata]|nr:hypothetical protein B0H14DRAFT_2571807 [Mycena olivaceomarginata]